MLSQLAVIGFSMLLAAQPIIGVAVSPGNLILDGVRVAGSASLFEGSVIEAIDETVQIRLRTGGNAIFARNSAARISAQKLDLLRGAVTVTGLDSSAFGMKIRLDGRKTATVRIEGGAVEVIPVVGEAIVTDAEGTSLTAVSQGKVLIAKPAVKRGTKPVLTVSNTVSTTAAQPIVTSTATPVCLSPCGY